MDTTALARLLEALPDAVVVLDGDGLVQWANRAAAEMLGRRIDDWIGASGLTLVHPDDAEMALLALGSVQGKDVGTPIEVRLAGAHGWRLVEVIGRTLDDGTIVLSLRDLTDRRRWEVAKGEDARFRSLVHNAASVTMLVGADGTVESVSGAITRLLGHDPERLGGRPLTEVVDPADRPLLAEAMARAVSAPARGASAPVTVEARLVRRDRASGEAVPYELTIVNLLDDPTVGGLVVSGHDVSRLRAAQDALQHMANHDALTGLANRAALNSRLATALARRGITSSLFVAFVDIDKFKPVNDLLGHDVGDELLVALADRLREAVRREDLVARLGGDEFVVVAEVDEEGAAKLRDRLEACVARPFELSVGPVHVQASVGMARASLDHSTEALLAEADAAMYAVKRARRGGPPEPSITVRERRALAEELGIAITEGQLVVHYQPVVSLSDRTLRGYEALVRWQHPERGLLLPGDFLGVAEDAGRDDAITEFVLRTACAQLPLLEGADDGDDVWVSINASGAQLARGDFANVVSDVLADAPIRPSQLCIEVTERAILERPERGVSGPVRSALDALAGLGVHLAIDDFGTGYSSLSHVVQFPLHMLKIDRSFVRGVGLDRDRHSVVAALVALAHNLGVTSIAEGIEEPRQLEELQRLGCDLAQGYLLGRPSPMGTKSAVATVLA